MNPQLEAAVAALEKQGASHADIQAFITQNMGQSGAGAGAATAVKTQAQPQAPYKPAMPFNSSSGMVNNVIAAGVNIPSSAMNLGSNMFGSWSKTGKTVASVAGGVAGSAAGAEAGGIAGGAIGSLLDPFLGPLGTIGGAALGTAVGGYMGAWLGSITANSAVTGQNPWYEMSNIAKNYQQKYLANGPKGFAQTVVNDPVGSALDFSIALDGFGSITRGIGDAGAAGSTAASAEDAVAAGEEGAQAGAKAAVKPNVMQRAGAGMQNVAGWTNPISFPFKALGASAGSTAETQQAAQNIKQETGVDTEAAMTAGMKKGGLPSLLEGIAAWLPGGSKITEKAAGAIDTIQTAATTFGSSVVAKLQDSTEAQDVESTVSDVAGSVKQGLTALKAATGRGYDAFFQTYGDVAAKMNGSSIMDSLNGIYDSVSNGVLDESLGKRLGQVLDKNGVSSGSDSVRQTIVQYYDNSHPDAPYSSLSPEDQAKVFDQAGLPNAGLPDLTLQNLKNISDWVGNEIGRARGYGTKALSTLSDAIDQTVSDTLKDTPAAEGRTSSPLDEWTGLGKSWHNVMTKFQSGIYKQLQGVLAGTKNAGQVLESVFGNLRSDANMKNWTNLVGSDNFNQMGMGYLFKKVSDAFEDPESGKTNGDILNGDFNPQKFLTNISKVPDSVWKNILDPEDYKMFQWAKDNSGDLQTLFKSLKGLESYATGSRTAPTGITYRRFVAPLAKAATDIASGGLGAAATAGWDAGTWLLSSWLYSRAIGSDWVQAIMGSDASNGLVKGLNAIGNAKGVSIGAATQNANQTTLRNTLSNDQLMNLMKTIAANPSQGPAIIQQGQQMGYWLPQSLLNTTSSPSGAGGQSSQQSQQQ